MQYLILLHEICLYREPVYMLSFVARNPHTKNAFWDCNLNYSLIDLLWKCLTA